MLIEKYVDSNLLTINLTFHRKSSIIYTTKDKKVSKIRKGFTMKCYTFSYGVGSFDGSDYDMVPAFEEGAYTDYKQALQHLWELNDKFIKEHKYRFRIYEEGYTIASCSTTNKIMTEAREKRDWETFDKELEKHVCYDTKRICASIIKRGYPPVGLYCMHETELK